MKKDINKLHRLSGIFLSVSLLLSCSVSDEPDASKLPEVTSLKENTVSFYGTTNDFASEAIYFLMTDRFVDGDPSNNQINQGGKNPTFKGELLGPNGETAYVGYMGGDFKGIANNAEYISDMGFTSIWLTPIVDQPDEAFAGGEPIEFGGAFKDGGKTGYHGYWGSNFFKIDEHLPSADLSFKQLTQRLKQLQIKTVLDVVTNHGSPAFTMQPKQQAKFGQLFDENGQLVADHQNLHPNQLDHNNLLHKFYNTEPDIMQLSDMNENNPEVLDYFTRAYLHWIEQGADAFRIDTIKHMPHHFWKSFSDNIREKHPDFFMFAESYSFDAEFIAQHTQPQNGAVSVLDFPGREAMLKVFEDPAGDFAELSTYLYLENGPYANPYELMTFYDNHDMSRINTTENGYIDAHNWLFTSRGIPVVYYGSEIGFMSGKTEHQGNRNYFGQDRIELAKTHPIHSALSEIANIRKSSIALQKGLQANIKMAANQASFVRVYQHQGINQSALVLLNKGDSEASFQIDQFLEIGSWVDAKSGKEILVNSDLTLQATVPAHDVAVYVFNGVNNNSELVKLLAKRMVQN